MTGKTVPLPHDRGKPKPRRSGADIDLRRVRQPKKSELIADEIRQWIVRRQLDPGDRLPNEKELIEKLRSSRGTVREALKILEAQGLVEITPGVNGGTRVATISYESATFHLKSFFYFQSLSWDQVYEFREQVEPQAAALATPLLTTDDLAALAETIELCREGTRGRLNYLEHRLEEGRFHRIIISRCPNPLLRFATLFVNDMLVDFVRFRNIIGSDTVAFETECVCAHQSLLNALSDRNADAVATRMREHIRALRQYLSSREQQVSPDFLMGSIR